MKRKGQATGAIMGVIVGFILVAVFSILYTPLLGFLEIGVNATEGQANGAAMAQVFNGIPLIIGIVVLLVFVALVSGRQQ